MASSHGGDGPPPDASNGHRSTWHSTPTTSAPNSGTSTPLDASRRAGSHSNLYGSLKNRISSISLASPSRPSTATTTTTTTSSTTEGWSGERGRDPSSNARYRDPEEWARKEGNPQSWAVIGKYMQRVETPSAAGDISGFNFGSAGGATVARASTSGGPSTSGFRSLISSGIGEPGGGLTEEPGSYAEVDREGSETDSLVDHGVENGHGGPHQHTTATPTKPTPTQADDSDSDSDTEDDTPPKAPPKPRKKPVEPPSRLAKLRQKIYPPSPLTKNVIKCVLAYLIAEAFTFNPFLSDLVGAPFDVEGPVRNAHVIATVSVYFNPAKTIGAMLEADLFTVIGVVYSAFLCCGSMAMTVFLDQHGGHYIIAHTIVLVFWLGAGFGMLAYTKVKVNKPTLTTGTITKEGAFHVGRFRSEAILQVTVIVVIGALISNLVCFLLWPGSATSKLQGDLNKTLNSFSTLLEMLTKTFLLDEEMKTKPDSLKKAIDAHQASFTTLKSSLSQAKFETFIDSRIRATTRSYDEAVASMTRLAQGLTGMRSGCSLQFDLMKAAEEGGWEKEGGKGSEGGTEEQKEEQRRLRDELTVLKAFRERVGKSLQALTWTSRQTLKLLRTSFVNTRAGSATLEALRHHDDYEAALSSDALLTLKSELQQSLILFKREHSQAIKILYQRLPSQTMYGGEGIDPFADPEEWKNMAEDDDGPNDNVFRIYYFCFNLEEWVKELSRLVDTFVSIRSREEDIARHQIELRKRWGALTFAVKTWNWLSGKVEWKDRKKTLKQRADTVKDTFSGMMVNPRASGHSPFPEIVDGALSSHQIHSSQLNVVGRLKKSFWHFLWHLRQPNIRFAIKTGAGVTVLASVAFIPSLRPLWLEWRGEWAIVSYMVIMAPTLGGTNFLALGRLLGTAAGAIAAVVFYTIFPENPYMLPILGALFSAPCFYVAITRPQYGPSSRFVLLTFNLTCLYAYNLREVDTHVVSIAFHRSAAVAFGVVYGLVVNLYIWPFEARRELRKGLSEFFLNSAYLYERIVRTYSTPPGDLAKVKPSRHPSAIDVTETSLLLPPEAQDELEDAVEDFIAMEVYLQLSLIKLTGLLESTKHEPRLKGPFPIATYRKVLASCQSILDLLTSIRAVTTKENWYISVRRDFVLPCQTERREMVGNVLLYFSVLSSVLTLKTPLPPYLPPAAGARDALVRRLRELPVVRRRLVRGGSEGLLYLAYAVNMKDVIGQLDTLGATFQQLYGTIGGAGSKEAFEALFVVQEEDEIATADSASI